MIVAIRGTPVQAGDRIVTGATGRVTLTLRDGSKLTLSQVSSLILRDESESAGGPPTSVTLLSGILHSIVQAKSPGKVATLEVRTLNADAVAHQAKYELSYHAGAARPRYPGCEQSTDVAVHEGEVEVSNALNPAAPHVTVPAHHETTVACSEAPASPQPL